MYKVVSSNEFINSIRVLDEKLKNIRLTSMEIDKKQCSITYSFICENTVNEELQEKIVNELEKIAPSVFKSVSVKIKKIVSDSDLVSNEIFKYLNQNYPSISLFLKETDIISTVYGDIVKYTLRLTKDGIEYVNKNGALIKLNEYLSTKFCSDFAGNTEEKEAEETISLLKEEVYESELSRIEHRTIKVLDVIAIDDFECEDLAIYIEDATSGDVTICGRITEITERTTKTGKPFYSIKLDDTTGRISGLYFTKKSTINKIKELKVDDEIIAKGTIGEYNGKPSFTFNKINRCTFPKDFVKKDKFKKKAPSNYKVIFPSKANLVKVKSVFEEEDKLPNDVIENTYVVFDIETTGLDLLKCGITELGAVKIQEGKIIEEFTSLIKPDYPIPQEIVEKTGITEEMVKDSPKISTVLPDFMKFIEGATLIGHNVNFDLGFIKKYANADSYDVNNKVLDTMELSKTYAPGLKSFGLKALADYFQITFHHHRALADTYATAE
ncbi:MAG: ribonuclease H-like domain-containing protein, partial [Firmicutes bacterium]|nr:ribonuclease H-like domain-containing protein [Candidatus Caballimonas caccae]